MTIQEQHDGVEAEIPPQNEGAKAEAPAQNIPGIREGATGAGSA
jgi:hypothetical protein